MDEQLVNLAVDKLAQEKGFLIIKPTQTILQKWLREAHNIHMFSRVYYDSELFEHTYSFDAFRTADGKVTKGYRCDTYEKAMDVFLINALEMIDIK